MTRFAPPYPVGISHFHGTWNHTRSEDPIAFWYEVAGDGACLRQVEIFPDGRKVADAVSNYPDGATEFGFGTLHGASFWDNRWDEDAEQPDGLNLKPVSAQAFESIWNSAA